MQVSKNNIIYRLVLFVTVFSAGCNNTEIPPAEYTRWVENQQNGLNKSVTKGNYQFSVQYKPIDYMIALQKRTLEIKKDELEREREKMAGMQYYNFKLSTVKGQPAFSSSDIDFSEKDRYLISGMQQDIFLLEGNDTLYCRMFHFEGANGILPYDNCVLAFDKSDKEDANKKLLYRANKLGLDWIEIIIRADDIKQTPKLKAI